MKEWTLLQIALRKLATDDLNFSAEEMEELCIYYDTAAMARIESRIVAAKKVAEKEE